MKKIVSMLLLISLIFPISPVLGDQGGSWEIDDTLIEDSIQSFIDAFTDAFFYIIEGVWDELIVILSSDVLGVPPELIIFVLGTAAASNKLLTGSFFPRVG